METPLDLKVFKEGSRPGLIPTGHGRVVAIQTFKDFGVHTHELIIVPGFYRGERPLIERGECSEGLKVDTVPQEQQDSVSRTLRTLGTKPEYIIGEELNQLVLRYQYGRDLGEFVILSIQGLCPERIPSRALWLFQPSLFPFPNILRVPSLKQFLI